MSAECVHVLLRAWRCYCLLFVACVAHGLPFTLAVLHMRSRESVVLLLVHFDSLGVLITHDWICRHQLVGDAVSIQTLLTK